MRGKKTGGRKAGTPNKVPVLEVRHVIEVAKGYTDIAIAELARLCVHAEKEETRLIAIDKLLDRAWGRIPNVEVERVPQITAIQIGPNRLNANGHDDAPPIELGPFRRG